MNRDMTLTSEDMQDGGQRRHLRWNFMAHSLDGGLYMAGIAFVHLQTILPKMVNDLGGPTWLISITPILPILAMGVPQLFFAHWLDRLRAYKPALLLTGFFQRIPFLIAGLALLGVAKGMLPPIWALGAVLLGPAISGISCGITFPAWMQLVRKTIPAERRAGVFAMRNLLAGVLGLGAGVVVKLVLDRWGGALGYSYLFILCFAVVMLSYLIFAHIRETDNHPPIEEHRRLWDNLREMPAFLRTHHKALRVMIISGLSPAFMIAVAFLSIFVLHVLNKEESFLGGLIVAQTIGSLPGNFIAGWLGDRFGSKYPYLIGNTLFVIVFVTSLFIRTDWAFYGLYFFFGLAMYMQKIGEMSMVMAACPERRGSTFLAAASSLKQVGLLSITVLALLVGGSKKLDMGDEILTIYPRTVVASVVLLLAAMGLAWRMITPEKQNPNPDSSS
jgi:MFS family permease